MFFYHNIFFKYFCHLLDKKKKCLYMETISWVDLSFKLYIHYWKIVCVRARARVCVCVCYILYIARREMFKEHISYFIFYIYYTIDRIYE